MKKYIATLVIIFLSVAVKAQTVLTAAELVYQEESFIDAQDGRQNTRVTPHVISFSGQYLKKQMRQRETVLSTTLFDAHKNKAYFYLTDSENFYYVEEEHAPSFFLLGTYEKNTPVMKLSDETATINGFDCKKATFSYNIYGVNEEIEVWYSPDYKLEASHLTYNFKELPGLPVRFKFKMLNSIQASMGVSGTREYSLISLSEIRPADVPHIENKEKYKYLTSDEKANLFNLVNIHGTKGAQRPNPQNKGEAVEEVIAGANGSSIKVLRFNPFKVGEPLPDFEAKDVNGKKKNLNSYKDKVVVLNFWFTECAPCIKEMPYLNSLTEKYKDKDIAFVSMTFNKAEDVKKFLKKQPFMFDNLTDAREIVERYGVSSYPLTVIIDKNKIVQYVKAGEANQELEAQINKLIVKN